MNSILIALFRTFKGWIVRGRVTSKVLRLGELNGCVEKHLWGNVEGKGDSMSFGEMWDVEGKGDSMRVLVKCGMCKVKETA